MKDLRQVMQAVEAGKMQAPIIKMGMAFERAAALETDDLMIDEVANITQKRSDGSPIQISGVFQGFHLADDGRIKQGPIPSTNADKKIVRFTLVMESKKRNRFGFIVKASGWKLDEYLRNGVVLWNHDQDMLPIGKNVGIGVQGKRLQQAAQFADHEHANDVHDLYAAGVLRAWSAGFKPLKWDIQKDGIDYLEQELFESSSVNVGADPNALTQSFLEDALDSPDLMKYALEGLEKIYQKSEEFLAGKSPDYVKAYDEQSEQVLKMLGESLDRTLL